MHLKHSAIALAAAILVATTGSAQAAYPEKPIKILVGASAGGSTDTTTRGLGSFIHEVEEMNGMPAVTINKPGGSGMIAAKLVKEAKPDGYTLFMHNSGTFSVADMKSFGEAPVQPLEDFQIIGCMSQLVTALYVPFDSEVGSATDFADWAKSQEGDIRWSNSGAGSFHTLAGHLLLDGLGVSHQPIPFKGGSGARNAIAAKKTPIAFIGVNLLSGFETKLRALAVTSSDRDPVNPDVPTLGESGLPALGLISPMCLWGSKELPEDVVGTLRGAVEKVVANEGFVKFMGKAGLAAVYATPGQGVEMTQALYDNLGPVVEKTFKK